MDSFLKEGGAFPPPAKAGGIRAQSIMKIDYNAKEDILFISFNEEPINKDITYDWNVNIGLTEHGIGQITILDAKASGMIPLLIPKKVLEQAVKTIN